jgi:hypothetical protein
MASCAEIPKKGVLVKHNKRHGGGPKTAEGLERCKFNATKFGLHAKQETLLPDESADDYNLHRAGMFESFPPRNYHEALLVDELAWLWWKRNRRLRRQEQQILTEQRRHLRRIAARDFAAGKLSKPMSEKAIRDGACLLLGEAADRMVKLEAHYNRQCEKLATELDHRDCPIRPRSRKSKNEPGGLVRSNRLGRPAGLACTSGHD